MSEPMILCPNCRVAIPDRLYYRHQREQHQTTGAPQVPLKKEGTRDDKS